MSGGIRGIWLAVSAYLLWGVLPVYWKALATVPAPQILAHRIVWSFGFVAVLVWFRREGGALRRSLDRRTVGAYALAAALLSVNWLTYIWAVNADRIVETSLGYYINPLVSVLLGVVVLRERLRRVQWMAVALAAVGVGYLTWQHGTLPWVALVLATSFAFYGLIKKQAPLASLPGLALETGLVWLPALAFLVVAEAGGEGHLFAEGPVITLLLVLTGVATGVPLLLFGAAARQINLSTIGLLQYLAPTCQLLIAVALYHEPFGRVRLVGFSLIWVALALYSAEGIWFRRARASGVKERSVSGDR